MLKHNIFSWEIDINFNSIAQQLESFVLKAQQISTGIISTCQNTEVSIYPASKVMTNRDNPLANVGFLDWNYWYTYVATQIFHDAVGTDPIH